MKNIVDTLLQHPGVEAFGLAILHSLWQGALVVAVLFVVLRFVRQNANLRYGMAYGALVCMLLAFGYTLYLTYTPPVQVTNSDNIPAFTTLNYQESKVFIPQTTEVYEEKNFSIATTFGVLSAWIKSYAHYIFAMWAMGFLIFSSRLGLGLYYAEKLKRNGQYPQEEWIQKLKQFQDTLGIKTSVQLLISDKVHTPLTLGWLKPVILLPVGMLTQLPYEHLESILLHELAHIKRHDYLLNLLQSVAETLLFFNPAYWYIVQIIDQERENACDDMAVGIIQQPMNYARALTKVAELSKADLLLSKTTVAANKGSLTERIRRIVLASTGQAIQRSEKTKWYLMSIIAVAILGTVLITQEVRGDQSDVSEAISTKEDRVVSGKVVEAGSGKPLPGINIMVEGKQIGTVTNASGKYSIKVPAGSDSLVYVLNGYKTERIKIDSQEEIDVELEVDVEQEIDIEENLDLDLDIDLDVMGANLDSSSLYNFLYTQWEYIKKQKRAKGEKVPDNILLSDKTLYLVDGEARDPKTIQPPFEYTISIPHTVMWASIWLFDFFENEDCYAAFRKKYPGDYNTVVFLTSKAVKNKPFTITGQVLDSKTKSPIAGTKVILQGTSTSTITDAEGNYSLRVPNDEAWLEFSNEEKGFLATGRPVKLHRNSKMDVYIRHRSSNSLNKLKIPEVKVHEDFGNPQKSSTSLKETLSSSDTGTVRGTASAIVLEIDENREDLPLYLVDGVEVSPASVKQLDPQSLGGIEVIQKETAAKRYGERGKNGVVLVRTKKALEEARVQLSSLSNSGNPLIIVDGKQYNDQQFALATLLPDDIASIDVLKGEEAKRIYGEKGKNGVVLITTKARDEAEKGSLSPVDAPGLEASRPPIFIIDGIRYTYQELSNLNKGEGKFVTVKSGNSEFKINLDPDDIISIDVQSGGLGITSSGKKPVDMVFIKTKSKSFDNKKTVDVGPSFQEAIDNATDSMLDTMTVDEIHAYNLTLDQALNRFQSSLHQYAKEKEMYIPVSTLDFSDDKVLYLLDGVKTNPRSIKYYNVQSVEVIQKDPNFSYLDKGSYGYLGVPNAAEKFEEYRKKYPRGYEAFVIATSKNKPKMEIGTNGLNNLTVFPNPSENIFTIQFAVEEEVPVQATVFNPAGHIVTTLTNRKFTKGQHELEWDATGEKPGLYRIRIIRNGETTYRNVVVK